MKRSSVWYLIILVFLLAPITPTLANNATQVGSLLRQLGFRPMSAPVLDLPLYPVGEDRPENLSKFQGKWIFLNFWATWCGPCRQEMPSVEKLYQKLPQDQIAVVGISIDQGSAMGVKKFLQQLGITFPNFHDQQGKLASAYQANSVPVVYLISPDWQLVGVFRGANNWDAPQILESLRQLIAIKEVGDLSTVAPPVSPVDLAPPTMQVRWQDAITKMPVEEFRVGHPVELVVAVSWEGSAYRYALKVPRPQLPANVQCGAISSQSKTQDCQVVLEYLYPLNFQQTGEIPVGPISLAFNDSNGQGAEQFARVEAINVQVHSPRLALAWIILLIFCGILTIGAGVWFMLTKRRQALAPLEVPTGLAVAEEMQILKKQNWEGDRQGYCLGLLALGLKCQQQGLLQLKWSVGETEALSEKIRYGGHFLSEAEIQYLEKIIINISGKEQV